MTVTPDAIGVVVAIFVALVTFIGAVGGLLSRQSRWISERFDQVDRRMDRVEAELVEVKIAVARLEGPQPRLLRP